MIGYKNIFFWISLLLIIGFVLITQTSDDKFMTDSESGIIRTNDDKFMTDSESVVTYNVGVKCKEKLKQVYYDD